MTVLTVADITNSTTAEDGTGVFDLLMKSVELHIVDQFDQGRITGTDYATVYLGALQSTLAEAIKLATEIKNYETGGVVELTKDKIAAETAEVLAGTTRAQDELAQTVALMAAQELGFKVDAKQKVLKQMFDGHTAVLSILGTGTSPVAITDVSIDAIINDILADLDTNPITIAP